MWMSLVGGVFGGGVGVFGGGSRLVEALLKTHFQVLVGSEIKGPKDVVKLLMHVFILLA